MKLIQVSPKDLVVSKDLDRSRTSKPFEERLRASIEEIGLAEPLKVAALPKGKYLVVDGMIRLRAIQAIRLKDPDAFEPVPAYVVDFAKRFELRYQTDIYQDLLPSQLASLVEHLHETEQIPKVEIARYIGVSPQTLRNYTGLWRLIQRRGLFARIVELMDVGVFPASNPYAWLRLNAGGLRYALESNCTDGERAEKWIEQQITRARRGDGIGYQISFVEAITSSLPDDCYRESTDVRALKREMGLRRAAAVKRHKRAATKRDATAAIRNLNHVVQRSPDRVLRVAARSLCGYLK